VSRWFIRIFAILVAISLILVAVFLRTQGLEKASMWAVVIALFTGTAIDLVTSFRDAGSKSSPSDRPPPPSTGKIYKNIVKGRPKIGGSIFQIGSMSLGRDSKKRDSKKTDDYRQ
jgi:hypothetical protein